MTKQALANAAVLAIQGGRSRSADVRAYLAKQFGRSERSLARPLDRAIQYARKAGQITYLKGHGWIVVARKTPVLRSSPALTFHDSVLWTEDCHGCGDRAPIVDMSTRKAEDVVKLCGACLVHLATESARERARRGLL